MNKLFIKPTQAYSTNSQMTAILQLRKIIFAGMMECKKITQAFIDNPQLCIEGYDISKYGLRDSCVNNQDLFEIIEINEPNVIITIKDLKESLSDSSKIVEWFVSKCGAFDIWKECDKNEQFVLPISHYRIKCS